jgi:hypothetical protein
MAAALHMQVCEIEAVSNPAVVVAPEEGRWGKRIKSFWGGQAFALRAAYAVAALVIAVGGAWLYLSRVRQPLTVASLELTSSFIKRSEAQQARTIKLSPDAGALRVVLKLPNNAVPTSRYRVEFEAESGEPTPLEVAEQDAQSVSVVIPASKLPSGDYALTLFAFNADGTQQPVHGTYIFTVK